jgi:hypothetical protein
VVLAGNDERKMEKEGGHEEIHQQT